MELASRTRLHKEKAQYAGRQHGARCGERRAQVSTRVSGMISLQNEPVDRIGATVVLHVATHPLVVVSVVARALY